MTAALGQACAPTAAYARRGHIVAWTWAAVPLTDRFLGPFIVSLHRTAWSRWGRVSPAAGGDFAVTAQATNARGSRSVSRITAGIPSVRIFGSTTRAEARLRDRSRSPGLWGRLQAVAETWLMGRLRRWRCPLPPGGRAVRPRPMKRTM